MSVVTTRLLPTKPRIAIACAGAGAPIVFLHGVGSTKENWAEQLEDFGRTHFAVAWDARGYGASDDFSGELDFARDFGADLHAMLDMLELRRVHLVGLSMGGIIAQCFYFQHPERVASLALAGTFPSFPALGKEVVDRFLAARLQPLVEGQTPADIAPAAVEALTGPNAPPAARERLLRSLSNLRKPQFMAVVRAMAAQPALGALESIRVPTLVIAGEHDRLSPPALAHDMARRIPNARLAMLEGAGHLTNMERPEAFNDALRRFLAELK